MSKLPMYVIMAVSMGLGGYAPTLFGANALDLWSVLGTVLGGVLGVFLYIKLKNDGIIE